MSATISEISSFLSTYNPRVSIYKNITISNYYYLHKDFKEFNSYCLYVCKSSQLPENIIYDDVVNLLIVLDKPLPNFLNFWNKYNLILLEDKNYNISNILESIQDFITMDSTLSYFTNELINAMSKNLNIDEIIKITFNYLKNPIIIANSSQHICTYYSDNAIINEPLWDNYINLTYPSITYWKKLYYDLNFRESISFFDKPIIVDYNEFMNHRMLISSIKKEDFHLAYIYVLEVNKPFCKIDMEILNILNKLLLSLIIRDSRFLISNNNPFDPLFYYLINDNNLDDKYIHDFIKTFDINLKYNLSLVNIQNFKNTLSFQKLKYFNEILKKIFNNNYIYFYNNEIYILYNGDINLEKEKLNLFSNFLKENKLKAGISQCFSSLLELKNALNQSKKSILMGNTLKPYKYIYNFYDYSIDNLVFTFINHYNLNDLLDINFIDFINNSDEDFFNTLKVYCINNGDMQKTSNELHIHYNTLKYRLQKIKDLYYLDVFDYDFIIQLKLSFLAINFLQSK